MILYGKMNLVDNMQIGYDQTQSQSNHNND